MAQSIDVVAPVPGLVASVAVAAGARVAAGDPGVILQGMKMEIVVASEHGGTVETGLVKEGEEVDLGAVLAGGRTAEGKILALVRPIEEAGRPLRFRRGG